MSEATRPPVPRWVTRMIMGVAILMVATGIVHVLEISPEYFEAVSEDRVGFPAQADVGLGHITWQIVYDGLAVMGLDTTLLGVVILLLLGDLRAGRRSAWRVVVVTGLYLVVVYTGLWALLEGAAPRPLILPLEGLLLVVPAWLGRRSFAEAPPFESG